MSTSTPVCRCAPPVVDQGVNLRAGQSKASAMAPPVPGLRPEPAPGTYRRVVSDSRAAVLVAEKPSFEFPQRWARQAAAGCTARTA